MNSSLRSAELSLVGDIWTSSSAWTSIRTLCDDFNGRFVASDDERNAAAFISTKLSDYGLSDVHTETFRVHGWRRGPAHLSVAGHALDCIALPGTPACDLTAPAVFCGDGEPADFERIGQKAKGRIAVVRGRGSHRLEKYSRARKAGCIGFLFGGDAPGCLPLTGSLEFGGKPAPIPGAGISHETLLRIERVLEGGEAEAYLRIDSQSFPATGLNVIGDIPGADPRAGMLMLCAHYDGHDIAQGAVDNASGAVAVMETARALMAVREHLNVGIRVALWSGEEVGMIGSRAYADAHKRELASLRFVFNCDIVANSGPLWLSINGVDCDRLSAFLQSLAADHVHDVQISTSHIVPYSDHFSFYVKGVPALMAATGEPKFPNIGPHTYGDTLDKVDMRGLRSSAAFVARALLRLANDPSPLPARHAAKPEIQAALRKAGYDVLLKAQGRWTF